MCGDRKFYEDFRQGMSRREIAAKYGVSYAKVCQSIWWYENRVAPYAYHVKLYSAMVSSGVSLVAARRAINFLGRNSAYSKSEVRMLLNCIDISKFNIQVNTKKEWEYCNLHPNINSIYVHGTGSKIIEALINAERDCK